MPALRPGCAGAADLRALLSQLRRKARERAIQDGRAGVVVFVQRFDSASSMSQRNVDIRRACLRPLCLRAYSTLVSERQDGQISR